MTTKAMETVVKALAG
ncbi:hypothetical protein [Enterobacter hormaechei]|nr:hypothetical protein [Enterobacter hormaechei]